ncbi:hypothetical protein HW555_006361 [Spodoptera exigua]|uniref:Uncharacterized protein n=1 Tax=Spodoptera exigua TaxID=7107 RepID=A0A835GG73_SPOEX|nr:hypothetical protein HW555_006361 [Spodoptera exigua]
MDLRHPQSDGICVPDAVERERHHMLTPEDVARFAAARHPGYLASEVTLYSRSGSEHGGTAAGARTTPLKWKPVDNRTIWSVDEQLLKINKKNTSAQMPCIPTFFQFLISSVDLLNYEGSYQNFRKIKVSIISTRKLSLAGLRGNQTNRPSYLLSGPASTEL